MHQQSLCCSPRTLDAPYGIMLQGQGQLGRPAAWGSCAHINSHLLDLCCTGGTDPGLGKPSTGFTNSMPVSPRLPAELAAKGLQPGFMGPSPANAELLCTCRHPWSKLSAMRACMWRLSPGTPGTARTSTLRPGTFQAGCQPLTCSPAGKDVLSVPSACLLAGDIDAKGPDPAFPCCRGDAPRCTHSQAPARHQPPQSTV